ncbi:MAG: DoxX family protein [Candidatus Limnocylindria bacterium]
MPWYDEHRGRRGGKRWARSERGSGRNCEFGTAYRTPSENVSCVSAASPTGTTRTEVEVEGPPFARFLFANTRAGLFWLPIRLFLGFSWLTSGLGKALAAEGGWLDGGSALAAYWDRAVSIPEAPARPPISYDWYRDFLNILIDGNHETWFAYVVVAGETLVGVGLILGALTGIVAFFGALMNMSFLLAGSASTNPVLFTAAIGLMLAWRVAGSYGLDRYLLPMLGTPWRPGAIARRGPPPEG